LSHAPRGREHEIKSYMEITLKSEYVVTVGRRAAIMKRCGCNGGSVYSGVTPQLNAITELTPD
jgi:hypothetical protein